MKKHLFFCLNTAYDLKERRHPQTVMERLKIEYEHASPQSIHDGWQFWNCTNLPDQLPEYLRLFEANPMDYVGYGLSEVVAKKLSE